MYKLLRPLLFLIDPETIHHLTFSLLNVALKVPGVRRFLVWLYRVEDPRLGKDILGLHFTNRVGLAAGFDKDARLIEALACFGFGFIEIGTLTPKPQRGNEKPRLFRLPNDQALINRMGFNNDGVEAAMIRLKKRKEEGRGISLVIGGNIGRNKMTSNELAFEDYNYCYEILYPFVDYFVINVSSPNTPDLRELQDKEPLKKLLTHVKEFGIQRNKVKPVLLKIAPDLSASQLADVIEILKETKTDGVIASNTTVSREGLNTAAAELARIGPGGLSGMPLSLRANEIISKIRKALGPDYPIIGVGGIMSERDALEKIKAGADLIQIYTGFVYEGPAFVKRLNRAFLTTAHRPPPTDYRPPTPDHRPLTTDPRPPIPPSPPVPS